MKYRVMVCGTATVEDLSPGLDKAEELSRHLNEVMDHLAELEDGDPTLYDADLSARLASGDVEISIIVDEDLIDEAAKKGIAAIRCAVHAAGGYTEAWDDADGKTWTLDDVSSRQEPLALAT